MTNLDFLKQKQQQPGQEQGHHHQYKELYTSQNQNPKHEQRRIFLVTEGHRSKKTENKYRVTFYHFLDYIRIYDLEVLLDLGRDAIQELVIKYVSSLRDNAEKKYSRSTVNVYCASILYFFDNNDIELNRRMIRRYYPSDESTSDDRLYTKDEIRNIISLGCNDLRSKAMILLMVSSGVRIGALHSMQIGHLIEMPFQDSKIYKGQVYAGTRDKYFTFTTPECHDAIQGYLNYRKRYGEELKDKSPLFRKHFNKHDPFTINVPKFMSEYSIMFVVDEALKKSGVKTSEARRSHSFRKGFKSICEQSGMKSINVELLMGHSIGVSGHYYRPADSDILEDYMNHAAQALTIDSSQRLKQENLQLRKSQNDYLAELGELRHDFNEMKHLFVHLNKDSQKQLVDEFSQKVGDKADIEWSCDD